jgi:hypothetical protein
VVDTTADKSAPDVISAQLRGETMGYALQSGITNLVANIFEPYINYYIQQRYARQYTSKPEAHGNYVQNLAGEMAGDLIGVGTLIAAEAMCPRALHSGMQTMREWVDPFYDSMARRVLAKEQAEPDFEQKVEKWKTFQERNLVRASIIAIAGVLGNVATQKIMGNPSPTKLIFLGKIASTSLTTALGLTSRFAFPSQMRSVDKWVGKRIAPLLQDKGMVGVSDAALPSPALT